MKEQTKSFDAVVIGGSPAGLTAALTLARLAHRVLLVERLPVLGGMLTNGIGKSDVETRDAIGGIFREFVGRVYQHYRETYGPDSEQVALCREGYYYEPCVAQAIIDQMVGDELRITVWKEHLLDDVLRDDNQVKAVRVRDMKALTSVWVEAGTFIDATYEGDLYGMAGAAFRLGREARDEFDEPHAGVVYIDHETHEVLPGTTGEGDDRLPAYTYRLCLTDAPDNRVPIVKPDNYDRNVYVGYLDDLAAGRLAAPQHFKEGHGYYPEHFDTMLRALSVTALPNRKYDVNINPRPLAFPFPEENNGYIQGDWATRQRIAKRHRDLSLGLLYFIQNDEAVPDAQRAMAMQFGLPRDEFIANGHFPWQLYVRVGRRLKGLYTLTEHDVATPDDGCRPPVHVDSIACGEFPIDSFPVRKRTDVSERVLEGYICMLDEVTGVYQVPFGIMLPEQITGIIVPVAASTTHVAFSSIRMEPTWMALGQAAGVAAHYAITNNCDPRAVPIERIQRMLLRQGQVVTYFDDVPPNHAAWHAMQFFGARGFFHRYDAQPDAPLPESLGATWMNRVATLVEPTLVATSPVQRQAREVTQAPLDQVLLTRRKFALWLTALGDALDAWNEPMLPSAAKALLRELGIRPDARPQSGRTFLDEPVTRSGACVALFRLLERIGY